MLATMPRIVITTPAPCRRRSCLRLNYPQRGSFVFEFMGQLENIAMWNGQAIGTQDDKLVSGLYALHDRRQFRLPVSRCNRSCFRTMVSQPAAFNRASWMSRSWSVVLTRAYTTRAIRRSLAIGLILYGIVTFESEPTIRIIGLAEHGHRHVEPPSALPQLLSARRARLEVLMRLVIVDDFGPAAQRRMA